MLKASGNFLIDLFQEERFEKEEPLIKKSQCLSYIQHQNNIFKQVKPPLTQDCRLK